jgi:hypothetical protein
MARLQAATRLKLWQKSIRGFCYKGNSEFGIGEGHQSQYIEERSGQDFPDGSTFQHPYHSSRKVLHQVRKGLKFVMP